MSYKSIYLSGYYGVCNVGDDLLLKIIVDKLLSYNPDYKISVTVNDKNNISEDLRNKICCIPSPKLSVNKLKRILETIIHEIVLLNKHDIYIYGGGTRLFETKKRTYQALLIKYLGLLFNKLFFGKKVIHLGNGIGYIESTLGKTLLKGILNLSTRLYLRDSRSYEKALFYLKDKTKARESFDLSYLLYDDSDEEDANSLFKIGLSFFDYYGYLESDNGRRVKFRKQVETLIRRLSKIQNAEFYLFSFQKKYGGNDEEFNEQLLCYLEGVKIVHVRYETNPMLFFNQLNHMNFCIGMRYHFCLLSLINKKPCIGINYQPKVKAEYEDLGIPDYVIEIDELDSLDENIVKKSYNKYFIQHQLLKRKNKVKEHFEEVNIILSEE